MVPTRGDGLLSTAQAARVAGCAPGTIRCWASRGELKAAGLDERGRPLYTRAAVIAEELRVRQNGLRVSGIDPRTLRHSRAA
jgi:DNA-binding transcriptional MerR regulator